MPDLITLVVTIAGSDHEFAALPQSEVVLQQRNDDGTIAKLAEFTVADLIGRVGECWRCGESVESTIEVAYIDLAGRNDCGEDPDGAPHEIDPPEGWED